jgi:drug/metabolite transporter (DMT)-like permease
MHDAAGMGAVGWALVSAFFGGLGVVLQQKGTLEAPPAGSRGFIGSILRKPVWLAGGACQIGCWGAQGIALSKGPLSVVQPVAALQIVIALPLGIWITNQVVGRREYVGAGLVVAAISAFVIVTNPASGRRTAPADIWLEATAVVAVITVAAAVFGARCRPATKAALYGTASGVVFGFQAAVMDAFVDVVPDGLHAILTSWSTYGLIASALGGFYLLQTALQIGALAPAIATSNAACPITSVVLGRVIFLENPQRTTGGKIVSAVSAVLLVAGLALLARGEAAKKLDAGGPVATPQSG